MRFDFRNRNSDSTIYLKQESEFRKPDSIGFRNSDFKTIITINKKSCSIYVQNWNFNFFSPLLSKIILLILAFANKKMITWGKKKLIFDKWYDMEQPLTKIWSNSNSDSNSEFRFCFRKWKMTSGNRIWSPNSGFDSGRTGSSDDP